MTPVIGMDVRIDDKGRLQPWRVVLATVERQGKYQEFLMRLPSGMKYMTPPYTPRNGDLTEIDGEPDERFQEVAAAVEAMGTSQVYAAAAHQEGVASTMLAWHGVTINPVDVKIPDHGYLDNPYGIGGESGHEIANIVETLGGPE